MSMKIDLLINLPEGLFLDRDALEAAFEDFKDENDLFSVLSVTEDQHGVLRGEVVFRDARFFALRQQPLMLGVSLRFEKDKPVIVSTSLEYVPEVTADV